MWISGRRAFLAKRRAGMAFSAKIGTLDCVLSVIGGLVEGIVQGGDMISVIF